MILMYKFHAVLRFPWYSLDLKLRSTGVLVCVCVCVCVFLRFFLWKPRSIWTSLEHNRAVIWQKQQIPDLIIYPFVNFSHLTDCGLLREKGYAIFIFVSHQPWHIAHLIEGLESIHISLRRILWGYMYFFKIWKKKVKVKSLSRVRFFVTTWTVAYQVPPSMGFSRQEYWTTFLISVWDYNTACIISYH